MRTPRRNQWRRIRLASASPLAVALAMAMAVAAATSRAAEAAGSKAGAGTPAPTGAIAIPQSTFSADPQTGRDPFFPKSARRITKSATQSEAPVVARFPDQIRLTGISGLLSGRLAMINYRTFAAGESGDIKVDGRTVSIRCDAVKETSAVITVNGISREIHLREGL